MTAICEIDNLLGTLCKCDYCGHIVPQLFVQYNDYNDIICLDCIMKLKECTRCGILTLNSPSHGMILCNECEEHFIGCCDVCNKPIFDNDDFFETENHLLCDDCTYDYTATCDWCENRFHVDDMISDDYTIVCDNCYSDYGHRCDRCGCIVHDNDSHVYGDSIYCNDCYELIEEENGLHNYGYRPHDIQFVGQGPHIGVELEIDTGRDTTVDYDAALDTINEYPHVWCTRDGSLTEYGIEFKTYPMGYDNIMQFPWDDLCGKLKRLGYRSHDATTSCGLHVHVSHSAFIERQCYDAPMYAQERSARNVLARVIYIHNKFWSKFVRFSRRTERQLESWANRYNINGNDEESVWRDISMYGGARHMCVNPRTSIPFGDRFGTYEFRMFRGTLNGNTIRATVQMVMHVINVAKRFTIREIDNMTWEQFISYIPDNYTELVEYLKQRGIYQCA